MLELLVRSNSTHRRYGRNFSDAGPPVTVSLAAAQAMVESVLLVSSKVFAQSGTFVVQVVDATLLQQGNDFVDEGIDRVLVDVEEEPETVDGFSFEPFLHVVSRH